jgi:photosystem II stability/assembly factor-like uncharacterized protein
LPNKHTFPQIRLPSPILSLSGDGQGGVYAGGTGGVAHFHPEQGWTPMISGLPLSGVSGFAASDDWLFAGGVEGLARWSRRDGGWQITPIEGEGRSIAAVALSPNFANDKSALAASLESGIFRSEDAGASWHPSNFGLQNFEVTSLLWASGENVLAGTASGIYRSPNGGRAWRAVDSTAGIPIAALVALPSGGVLALTDDGGLLTSPDGARWQPLDTNLPDDAIPTACLAYGDTLLLGTSVGLFASADGTTWQPIIDAPIFALAVSGALVYAGTGTGLIASSDGGQTWQDAPLSPLHDLRYLTAARGNVIVSGGYSVALRARADHPWIPLLQLPLPLSLLKADAGGRLFASGVDGLFVSDDAGDHWQQVLNGEQGHLAHLAIRSDGRGWGASADSRRLLRTIDGGLHWEVAASPLGADHLVALQAADSLLFAATYSPNQQIARLWHSADGEKWSRGAEARTGWSVVATAPNPPMVALGNTILAQNAEGEWNPAQMPADAGLVRRFAASGDVLLALTTRGILISRDHAASFAPLDGIDLPNDQMMDIALDGSTLYTLSVDGWVHAFDLST